MSKAKKITGSRIYTPEKIGILYLLLIPMFISVVKALFSADYSGFLLAGLGFLLLFGSVTMANRGFTQSIEYHKAILAKAPKIPYKKLAAFGLGVTAFYLSFFVGGKPMLTALFLGILAPLGFYLYYGFDPKTDKLGNMDGISAKMVLETIKEANTKLSIVKDDMKKITDKILHSKLTIATKKAETILQTIQEDPKDVRVARKFLIVYIDGISKVTSSYTDLDESDIKEETKTRLYTLLSDVDLKFNQELQRLKENNHFDLDVHIDVLKQQIKN